jgi:hypothetical protein
MAPGWPAPGHGVSAYWAIVIFLAGSVIVGAGLAEALSWQWA